MVYQAMGVRWIKCGIRLSFLVVLILLFEIQGCCSLNSEGLALLEFRARVDFDPYGALANWNPKDDGPCKWSGVICIDRKVQILDLNDLSLEGILSPQLGNLTHLRSLVLSKNYFSGTIPKEIGSLTMLEVLDLRNNKLSGTIPVELTGLRSLKRLSICNNVFEGGIPLELGKLSLLSELEFDENLTPTVTTGIACLNRKFGIWQGSPKQLNKANYFFIPIKRRLIYYLNLLQRFRFGKESLHTPARNCSNFIPTGQRMHMVQNVQVLVSAGMRRLLQESSNLAAAPVNGGSPPEPIVAVPISHSSGSFPAVPNAKKGNPPPVPSSANPSAQPAHNTSTSDNASDQKPSGGNMWKYIVVGLGAAILLIIAVAMLFMCRSKAVSTIGPWKTGLSGQLQKAFVTGVPKLNRAELEAACEDFSNIIDTIDGRMVYKGTLSSGVEIAVTSTTITTIKDWSKHFQRAYRKKIDMLSRVNHKNFVNLIGYCEEEEPFTRMMVFEYAPNGTLFEHLHVKEVEHLDWNARMRIIMGTAYCLQYMHDLNPPVAHSRLTSNVIFLTDDYAAKIAEISFGIEAASNSKNPAEDESEHAELPPSADPETNVYSFGIMLLEIISGKVPYAEGQGSLSNWAAEYVVGKQSINTMIDPTLKSFKNNELDLMGEVILLCVQQDPRKRPTMKEITSKLREAIAITPDQAIPRLSPLWWAELEILSAEAT